MKRKLLRVKLHKVLSFERLIMKNSFIKIFALAFAVSAPAYAGGVGGGNANSNWTIYGWQSVSYEFRNADVVSTDLVSNPDGVRDRDYQQYNDNASNIGFAASIDTGISMGGQAITADFQCEQFTFRNRNTGTGFCNRNSKLGLSGAFGDLHVGQWLLPANEIIAQWIDPFYDHDMNAHSNLIGSVGYGNVFYNGGFGENGGVGGGGAGGAQNASFNRRQEEIVQYWSPNLNGFHFRIATSNAHGGAGGDEVEVADSNGDTNELDPRIWSTGIAYENTLSNGDNVWLAVAYEKHDEWSAVDFGCSDSDDDSLRLAGRYIKQWGNGSFTRISAAWETLEYDWEDCSAGTLLTGAANLGADANNLELEKDTWLISGVQNFGNGFDFRFMYLDAGEFDCDTCATDDDTDATFYSLGIYYNTPAGTEFRLTYNDLDNESNANYDYAITPTGTAQGGDASAFGLGLTQWF